MDAGAVTLPAWLDLLGIAVGGLQGSVFAARREDEQYDLVAVTFFAAITALGGGIVRDVLINQVPAALVNLSYLVTVLVATVVGVGFAAVEHRLAALVVVLDAGVLGVFTAAGTLKGLRAGLSPWAAVLLGVITGVGGGVLRDLVAGDTPYVFRSGPAYALASLAGAVLLVGADGLTEVGPTPAVVVCILLVFTVRLLSLRFAWHTPVVRPPDVSRVRRRVRSRPLARRRRP